MSDSIKGRDNQLDMLISEYRDDAEYATRLIETIDTFVYLVLGDEPPGDARERLSLLENAADIRRDLMILSNRW